MRLLVPDRAPSGRTARICTVLAFGLCMTPGDALCQGPDPLQDDFTSVEIEGYLPYRTGAPSSPHVTVGSETTEGAPTSFEFTAYAPVNWSSAEMHGTGTASFGSLGATLSLSGPSAREASVYATFHDVFLVSPPLGVAPGTPGTMSFVYLLDGLADATGLPGETPDDDFPIALVQMTMREWMSNGQEPPAPISELLGTASFEVVSSTALGGGVVNMVSFDFLHWATIEVPFEYGIPIALQVLMRIGAFTDNDFLRLESNPFGQIWGGGVVQSVYIDASNTVQLVAIVNDEHPEAAVTGVSVDYSSLVTDTTPAPEPSARALGAAAVAVVLALARQRRRRWRARTCG